MSSKKILVVDDDPAVAQVIKSLLGIRGYTNIIEVHSGRAALDVSSWDLMILDHMMPGISGLDVLRQLEEPHGPVIVVTARDERKLHRELRHAGAASVVMKPFTSADIASEVQRFI